MKLKWSVKTENLHVWVKVHFQTFHLMLQSNSVQTADLLYMKLLINIIGLMFLKFWYQIDVEADWDAAMMMDDDVNICKYLYKNHNIDIQVQKAVHFFGTPDRPTETWWRHRLGNWFQQRCRRTIMSPTRGVDMSWIGLWWVLPGLLKIM